MNKPDKPLRIMIADDDATRAQTLSTALASTGYEIVAVTGGDTHLHTLVADSEPDLVLINTESPSRDTLEQLTTIHHKQPRPVVMFASDEDRGTIRAAVKAGVSAYVTHGIANSRVASVIETAIAQFNQHQSVVDELKRTKQTLEERKVLDRAKGILMKRRSCTEEEAFALLRQAAMNHKKRLGQVAEEIVQAAALLDADAGVAKGVRP
ncbi:MAG: ANTAR domain-containing protein [Planctomycetota bacterium]